jgi:hypothetical protein
MLKRPGVCKLQGLPRLPSLHLLGLVVNHRDDFNSVLRQHSDALCRFIAACYTAVTSALVSRSERHSEPLPSVWETLVLSRGSGQFGSCQDVW